MKEKKINEIIDNFRKSGRFTDIPAVDNASLNDVSRRLQCQFPEDYQTVLTIGSFYKANIHFIQPEINKEDHDYIIFAYWNESRFAFHKEDLKQNKSSVYILVGDFIEKKYETFAQWFQMVYETATQPFASE